ncbi:MAG: gamma-glutamyltransferase [Myxococcota bacterium]
MKPLRGAIAAGNPYTARAGLNLLDAGGNAVDAAVGAMLAAGVAEPVLTGLAGAGIAAAHIDGQVIMMDAFTNMPGLGRQTHPSGLTMDQVLIDYGPTVQPFHIGPASVAVPSLSYGLVALHERHGRLPLRRVVMEAATLAEDGVVLQPGIALILQFLWPILSRSPDLIKLLAPHGRLPEPGDRIHNPNLANTLRALGERGDAMLRSGPFPQAIVGALGDRSLLTEHDLASYEPRFVRPLRYRYRDATIWVPPPPSVAGMLVLQSLRELEDHGPMPPAFGIDQVRLLAAALQRASTSNSHRMKSALFQPGFIDGFMTAIAPDEDGEAFLSTVIPEPPESAGHTTHISVVDHNGDFVGITTSLGETSGIVAGESGVILNNFLGEEDVNPTDIQRTPGQRLMTMCCPTIVEKDNGQRFIMGSAGSSRIRSAILHAIVYLVDHNMTPAQAAAAPRCHAQQGKTFVELFDRPENLNDQLDDVFEDLTRFEEPNMFFGGLNLVGSHNHTISGGADPRRTGHFEAR